jgi:hypothetical protein
MRGSGRLSGKTFRFALVPHESSATRPRPLLFTNRYFYNAHNVLGVELDTVANVRF